jgi:PAS domain-containing protein
MNADEHRPAGSARRAASRTRAVRWALGMGVGLMCAIGLVLLFLLTQATNNRALYERNFTWLLGVNVLVALVLFTVLVWGAVRLGVRLKRGRFGSRLLVKLAGIFGLVGVVPGLLIYVVSYQFVSRSIESWFDVRVEGALSAGVSLARVTLDTIAGDLASKTRTASSQLAQVPDAAAGLVLERMRDQLGATDLVLWSVSGQPLASAGQSRFSLNPERPGIQQFRNARQQRATFQIEGLDDITDPQAADNARVRALVVVQSPGVGLLAEPRFLQATLPLPQALVANAIAVQEANREYQERALARGGLRRMYIGTLTLALFLAVFGAVLLAVLLGHQIARPLLVLADGVREVAAGNLAPKAALQSRDELGGLTRSFALMTQQLADARAAALQSMGALDDARGRLQTILDNLTAGVIVLDAQGVIRSSNPGATRILRAPLAAYEGRALADVPGLADFAAAVQRQFDTFRLDRDQHSLDHWQHPFELHGAGGGVAAQGTSLVARLCPARPGLGRGGTPPGARNQEPAHPHPALGRAPCTQARRQAARGRAGCAHQIRQNHRGPSGCHEAPGQRVPRLRAPAGGGVAPAGSQCPGGRRVATLWRRKCHCAGRGGTRPPVPVHRRRRTATAPGGAQPPAERAGCHAAGRGTGRQAVAARAHRHALERIVAARASYRLGLRAGIPGTHPATRLRALRDHQAPRNRPGLGGRQENRRRAWRPYRPGQSH